jgi:hypothetical protein
MLKKAKASTLALEIPYLYIPAMLGPFSNG